MEIILAIIFVYIVIVTAPIWIPLCIMFACVTVLIALVSGNMHINDQLANVAAYCIAGFWTIYALRSAAAFVRNLIPRRVTTWHFNEIDTDVRYKFDDTLDSQREKLIALFPKDMQETLRENDKWFEKAMTEDY